MESFKAADPVHATFIHHQIRQILISAMNHCLAMGNILLISERNNFNDC